MGEQLDNALLKEYLSMPLNCTILV